MFRLARKRFRYHFGISSTRHASDLGVDVSFGSRSVPTGRKRAKRALVRARRIRGLAKKHARASRLLFKGGASPQSTCVHQIWDTSMKRLRPAAAWTSGGYRAGMCTTTLLAITKTVPTSRLHAGVITEYLVFLRDNPLQTKRIERAWQLLLRRFEKTQRKRRWFQVRGFLSNVIATLLDLEWKPVTAMYWINDLEDTWTFDLSKTFDLVYRQ